VFSEREKSLLRELAREIAQTPLITISPYASSLKDFSKQDQETVRRLDKMFWEEINRMGAGAIFSEVKPIGGWQKAEAVKDAANKSRVQLSDVLYVGDSITDVEAFKLVRENGGLTVSFNGNQYAVKNAEVAVLSENNMVTAVIAELWCNFGKQETLKALKNWGPAALKQSPLSKAVLERLFTLYPAELPKLQIVTAANMETLVRESSEFRKKVRGEAVGRLG
jgi:energy-converting hydrogenase A subunit R